MPGPDVPTWNGSGEHGRDVASGQASTASVAKALGTARRRSRAGGYLRRRPKSSLVVAALLVVGGVLLFARYVSKSGGGQAEAAQAAYATRMSSCDVPGQGTLFSLDTGRARASDGSEANSPDLGLASSIAQPVDFPNGESTVVFFNIAPVKESDEWDLIVETDSGGGAFADTLRTALLQAGCLGYARP
jgi:hypothetical protein